MILGLLMLNKFYENTHTVVGWFVHEQEWKTVVVSQW